MTDIVLFGAGGHAREVAQLIADINQAQPGCWNLVGFVADPGTTPHIHKPLPAPLLGGSDCLHRYPHAKVVIAVGGSKPRQSLVQRLAQELPQLQYATLVHPRAWLAGSAVVGEGCVVFAGALVNADVVLGAHGLLNLGCTISHDSVLAECASLGPGAHLAGGVTLGAAVDIGVGAVLRPRVQVGRHTVIGAGAVVVCDLPQDCTAIGVPAHAMERR